MMMNCAATRTRLTAWQDGELPPHEEAQVLAHLRGCSSCRLHEKRLSRAEPKPFLTVPDDVREDLWRRLDDALDEAWAEDARSDTRPTPPAHHAAAPAPRPSGVPLPRSRTVALPYGALALYVVLLVASVGWGLHNWLETRDLEASIDAHQRAWHHDPTAATIPADQYRPASWSPSADDAGP